MLTQLKADKMLFHDPDFCAEHPKKSKIEVLYIQYYPNELNFNTRLAQVLREYALMIERGIAGKEPIETYMDDSNTVLHAIGSILGEYETLLPYPMKTLLSSHQEPRAEQL